MLFQPTMALLKILHFIQIPLSVLWNTIKRLNAIGSFIEYENSNYPEPMLWYDYLQRKVMFSY